jgi:CRISPR-associated protein Cas7/Cse4/CasC, subtype I-E/ECOLI
MAMREFSLLPIGTRTKLISKLIANACLQEGATEDQAAKCGEKIENIFIKKAEKPKAKKGAKEADIETDLVDDTAKEKTDTLLFLSPNEVVLIAQKFAEVGFEPEQLIKEKDAKKQAKELEALMGKHNPHIDALDIALFGRMVAQAAELNVEAAASFAHAISTHKVSNEVEFFTALDDLQEEPGSAHMGSLEFNSATYYRYVSLDLGQLWQTLGGGASLADAVEAFTKALFIAVPSARQTTQSGASGWDYARVLVRKGQRLQLPFDKPVQAKGQGYLEPSIEVLEAELKRKEQMAGSMFGKLASYQLGGDSNTNIDDLVAALRQFAEV